MNLRTFHIVFVTVATLATLVFGGWCWRYAETQSSGTYRTVAMISFGAAAALIVYGFWFWRKINSSGRPTNGNKGAAVVLVLLAWLLGEPAVDACTVCYGEAEGPMIDAARNGVWLLFGLVFSVQICFVSFFVYLWRRGRKFTDAATSEELIEP